MQHQVPHDEAVRGRGQGEQLQYGGGPGSQGGMPERHRGAQAEPALHLPLQKGHEKGKELPAHLLGHLSDLTRLAHTSPQSRNEMDPPTDLCLLNSGTSTPFSSRVLGFQGVLEVVGVTALR